MPAIRPGVGIGRVHPRRNGGFDRFPVFYKGRFYQYEKQRKNGQESGSSITVELDGRFGILVQKNDSRTVNISAVEKGINDFFGLDSLFIVFIGTGYNNGPSGTITFNPPSGATVNGTTSAAFSGFVGPAVFALSWRTETNDYEVRCAAGKVDVLSSVAATPNYTGQFAVSGGVGYMAVGTSSSADWKQITN